jgi:hypothetical protein
LGHLLHKLPAFDGTVEGQFELRSYRDRKTPYVCIILCARIANKAFKELSMLAMQLPASKHTEQEIDFVDRLHGKEKTVKSVDI